MSYRKFYITALHYYYLLLRFLSKHLVFSRFNQLILWQLPYFRDSREVMSLLIRIYRPRSFLEIGVGKGDTLKQFLSEAQSLGLSHVEYFGFDTFDVGPPADETEILNRRIAKASNDDHFWQVHFTPMKSIFKIPDNYKKVQCDIRLFKGNTKETIPKEISNLRPVDMVYIDGGHSYETVSSDWHNIKPLLKTNTVIIFDDFNCEKGVSKFIGELLSEEAGFFSKIILCPATLSNWQCLMVVIEYDEVERSRV